ncbi:hypothetical protein [Cysteiniphilum halobium]|uniref:hypothetical protein n=1 Tax=Cysteiniphilum halobium TaxID=2219059 RepID=UPI003F8281CA
MKKINDQVLKILYSFFGKAKITVLNKACANRYIESDLEKLVKDLYDSEELCREFSSNPIKVMANYNLDINSENLDHINAAGNSFAPNKNFINQLSKSVSNYDGHGNTDKDASPQNVGNDNHGLSLGDKVAIGGGVTAGVLGGIYGAYKWYHRSATRSRAGDDDPRDFDQNERVRMAEKVRARSPVERSPTKEGTITNSLEQTNTKIAQQSNAIKNQQKDMTRNDNEFDDDKTFDI